jgi:ATP-dependent helicase HepA
MTYLKVGMYVRCPIDQEFPNEPRRFALGQISNINSAYNELTVKFFGDTAIRSAYEIVTTKKYFVEEVIHSEIQPTTQILIGKEPSTIISSTPQNENGFYQYFVSRVNNGEQTVELISEEVITAPFSAQDLSPMTQFQNYEFHNPVWYQHRQIVMNSLQSLRNATFGFETLIGSRVFLLPHQVDTIIRVISEKTCRFMLADEVGLGKTIEAAVIKKGLQKRMGDINVIILAPESLIYQWRNELSYKFWEDVPVWEGSSTEFSDQLIFPIEKANTPDGIRVLRENWDLCIVDETHRLLKSQDLYDTILDLSNRVQHLLLLTATPIQSRRTEYLKLLALLEPPKYSVISEEEFEELLKKQSFLTGKIHALVRDLEDYFHDELAEDYLDELEEMADKLDDEILDELIESINITSEDQGYQAVQLAIAYIAEHYQIERKIIRHRRKELEDRLKPRVLETIEYQMSGSERGFYELETYDSLLSYLEHMTNKSTDSHFGGEYIRLYLSAMFSSPFALSSILEERVQFVKGSSPSENNGHGSIISSLPKISNELSLLESLNHFNKQWMAAVESEFERLDELYDDPELISGRLLKVVDYLSESIGSKFVIFTNWRETLIPFKSVLEKKFGSGSVRSFYKGLDDLTLQQNVDDFQSGSQVRFMVCDELGGEGRNFQMADEIIHLDLPWSPSQLEQRIGRLDRIGRTKDVVSVVPYAIDSLDEDLFKLWDSGLNIFQESLSGLEIALGDIKENIQEALLQNLRYGMLSVIEKIQTSLQDMRKRVEQERYFDIARQLDKNVQEHLVTLIENFDGENGKKLGETMMAWSTLAGLRGKSGEQGNVTIFVPQNVSIKSMKNTLFIPPNMNEAHRRAKRVGEVRGTFNREYAIKREDLVFYAPGDPFFDAIVNNASQSEMGRSCAFIRENSEVEWKGFIFTWSVHLNPNPLFEQGEYLENLILAQGYLPLEPIIHAIGYSEEYNVSENIIKETVKNSYAKGLKHLGQRSSGRISQFREEFQKEEWIIQTNRAYQESYQKVKKQVNQSIDLERAKIDFQRKINGLLASNYYYKRLNLQNQHDEERLKNVSNAIIQGLENPRIRLESIAYAQLNK